MAVRSYLTPLPYGVIPRIRNPIDLLGRRGGQAKMGGERRPWKRWEGWAQQEGLWKGTPCKHRLLFQGLDEESCDPSSISDETVGRITNSTPTGAREYTEDIFSCWTLTYTYVHCFILWKMLHFLLKYPHQAGSFCPNGEKGHCSDNRKCGNITVGEIHLCKKKIKPSAQLS